MITPYYIHREMNEFTSEHIYHSLGEQITDEANCF